MYADKETDSMRTAISETSRRRIRQEAYNIEHGITPQSIVKQIGDVMSSVYERDYMNTPVLLTTGQLVFKTQAELDAHIESVQGSMRAAAANLDFEKAASLRDDIKRLRDADLGLPWPVRRG